MTTIVRFYFEALRTDTSDRHLKTDTSMRHVNERDTTGLNVTILA